MKKKASKAHKHNVYLSDQTKHRVRSKTHWIHRTYDQSVMALCTGNFNLSRENNHLKLKNQTLTEALSGVPEAIECCQGCGGHQP